jgi:flagellar hook-basal body complex protein FliE
MYGNMTALNELGLGGWATKIAGQAHLTAASRKDGEGDSVFSASLLEALEAMTEQQDADDPTDNASITGEDTYYLSQLYRNMMFQGLGYIDVVPDAVTGTGVTDDDSGFAAAVTTDATGSGRTDVTATSTPTSSISEIVFSTGYSNTELITKINNANTIDERLGYAAELRDKIVSALNNAGYTATAADSADKLIVDGKTYDVIKASKGIGRNTAIQLLEVPEGSGASGNSNSVVDAIFKAGETGISLLRQLSSSFNVTERHHLASQIQQMMVDYLNGNGYTASTTDSPDKIVVNGTTYDFIRGLNAPGQRAQYQAMKV